VLKRQLKYNLIKFLRLHGAPSKLALGFAVGATVNFYPTFGFGVALAGVLAALFFSNIPAGLLGDIIFKPLFPLFFYLNLITGHFVWTNRIHGFDHLWSQVINPGIDTVAEIGRLFFTGALINSLILGTLLYVTVFVVVKRYRRRALQWLVARNRRQ